MKEEFIELLKSTNREGMDKLLAWIEKSDFYKAPASTRFHGSYEGGLLEHSLNVYKVLKQKLELVYLILKYVGCNKKRMSNLKSQN